MPFDCVLCAVVNALEETSIENIYSNICLLREINEPTAQSTTQISVDVAVHNVHIMQCTLCSAQTYTCTEKFFPQCIDGVGEAKWILRNFFAIAQTTNDASAKYWYFLFVWQCRRTFLWKMSYQPKSWHRVCVPA